MNPTLTAIIDALGWTLLHFLWQGTAIAAFLWLATSIMRRMQPSVRYAAACLAMVAMLLSFVATFSVVYVAPAKTASPRTSSPIETNSRIEPTSVAKSAPARLASKESIDQAGETVRTSPPAMAEANNENGWLTALVGLWILGASILSRRFLLNWNGVRRLRLSATSLSDHRLVATFDSLRARLQLSRAVEFLVSTKARVPMVIGSMKPVILIPAKLITGLDSRQLKAIVAHELSHISRHDYLINLVQNLVEALLFYHPAVWWVAARIRQEREHRSDDIAAEHCGGALGYGRALLALEEQLLIAVKAAHYNTILCKHTGWREELCKKHGIKMMVDLLAGDHHVYKNPDGLPLKKGKVSFEIPPAAVEVLLLKH